MGPTVAGGRCAQRYAGGAGVREPIRAVSGGLGRDNRRGDQGDGGAGDRVPRRVEDLAAHVAGCLDQAERYDAGVDVGACSEHEALLGRAEPVGGVARGVAGGHQGLRKAPFDVGDERLCRTAGGVGEQYVRACDRSVVTGFDYLAEELAGGFGGLAGAWQCR